MNAKQNFFHYFLGYQAPKKRGLYKIIKKGVLYIFLLLAGAFCACQPTPEREAVVNKGDGVLEQRIAEAQAQEMEATEGQPSGTPTPAPSPYALPNEWQLRLDLPNFQVNIDADLEMPQGPYPIIRLSQNSFSEMQDVLALLMNQIIPAPIGRRQGTDSYESYAKRVERIALGRYDSDAHVFVSYSKEEQKKADEEMKEIASLMETALHEGEYDEEGEFVTKIGTKYTYVTKSKEEWYVLIEENYFSVSSNSSFHVYPESYYLGLKDHPADPDPTPYPNVRITEEQALHAAQEVLDVIPETQWTFIRAERAGLLKKSYNVLTDEATTNQGYLLTFTRKIGDTPFLNYSEGGSDRLHFDDTPYAATLSVETLQIFVDEEGIQLITWMNPITIEETVAKDIELLPFEQIQDIFVQTLKNGLSWAAERPTSNGELNPTRIARVEKCILAYEYIQEKDNMGKYLAVPTWFFSYRTGIGDNALPVYITISAVDGTRIAH